MRCRHDVAKLKKLKESIFDNLISIPKKFYEVSKHHTFKK